MERKNFSPSDFKVFHPGGALGKRLLRVADLMHGTDALPLCRPDTVVSEAILIMTAGHFGCVGIVDDNRRLIVGPELFEHERLLAAKLAPQPRLPLGRRKIVRLAQSREPRLTLCRTPLYQF